MSQKSERRNGMIIDWDVPITMEDGIVLRADVYRPIQDGRYPVIMSYGPYGKWLTFQDGYPDQWRIMAEEHPDVTAGSSNKYQNWEVVDPEKWVPDGYVCVRVDSRGCGRSPGYVDMWSAREAKDFYHCIEWAAMQPWSTGKIGLNGISYYAMNQWQVAALQPPHLTAMCAWEGAADFYRDLGWHGGILCTFAANWYDMQVKTVQHGVGKRGYRSGMVDGWVAGPETLTQEELGANRCDFGEEIFANPLDSSEYWQSRMPDWSKVTVPFLSAANWGGQGLHPRGNFEAVCPCGLQGEVAGGARYRALDGVLHRLRHRPAKALLRPFSQGRGYGLAEAAARAVAGAPYRPICPADGERMADRPDGVDEVLPQSRRPQPQPEACLPNGSCDL